ncbi:ABC transporter permease [Corynebacterium sp. TAE3-ERU12]|uniref:FtsX-like permease family protein n=1 Tax=Corynebacterium sp. TAE3-ERU12 TaxID=2849491 RepID=UPI001C47688E|nr:ABC transporter permease [Corynebacterium sp. TAE3-ERU12]MBV7295911.1 ABC transporter permease [Corynebacterium sp. TAE3-ERU12]
MSNTATSIRELPRPKGLSRLAGHLAAARWQARTGDRVLAAMSIAAFAVAATIANIVASGTWMFYHRSEHPTGIVAEVLAEDPTFKPVIESYFVLALLACALLVFPVVHLATSATLLGARSREQRLAILRLLGMTRREVSTLGFLEVIAQAVLGIFASGVLTLALLPLFQQLTFQTMRVRYAEMLMPWWGFIAVAGAILLVTALATVIGLIRVQISPLGVARREPPLALRWGSALIMLALLVVAEILARNYGAETSKLHQIAISALIIVISIATVDLIMPRILQLLARLLARVSGMSISWASRRVAASPKPTWRRIAVLSFMVLIASFLGQMPISATDLGNDTHQSVAEALLPDVRVGLLFTIGFSFTLAAISTMVNQASAEFERANETRAMLRMGVADAKLRVVTWIEALGPLVGSILLCLVLGQVLADVTGIAVLVSEELDLEPLFDIPYIAGISAAGVVLMVIALAATGPIHRQITRDERLK